MANKPLDIVAEFGKRANGKDDLRTIGTAWMGENVITLELSSNVLPLRSTVRVDEYNGTTTQSSVQEHAPLKIFLRTKGSKSPETVVADDEEVSMEF